MNRNRTPPTFLTFFLCLLASAWMYAGEDNAAALPVGAAADKGPAGCTAEGCHRDLLDLTHVPGKHLDDDSCGTCHAGPVTGHPADTGEEFTLVGGSQMKLCLGCHEELAAIVLSSGHIHTPVRQGRCTECHTPHGESSVKLLRKVHVNVHPEWGPVGASYEPLCWECHDQRMVQREWTSSVTNFRDDTRNLHFLHMNSPRRRSCQACHSAHASDQEMHISTEVPFGKMWRLPISFTRTSSGGTCVVGCHKEHTYARSDGEDTAPRRDAGPEAMPTASRPSAGPVERTGEKEPFNEEFRKLVLALKDGSPDQRRDAARNLGDLGDPLAVPPLAKMIRNREPFTVLAESALALARIGGEEAENALGMGLSELRPGVQRQVIRTLAPSADEKVISTLITVARLADPRLRSAVVEEASLSDNPAIKNYVLVCLNDKNGNVRIAAALALDGNRTDLRNEVLVEALGSRDLVRRRQAAAALAKDATDKARHAIVKAVADKDPEVRRDAARALGRAGTLKEMEILRRTLDDPDQDVRLAAYQAALEISTRLTRTGTKHFRWPAGGCIAGNCHASYAKGRVVHAPAASGGCFLCHEGRPELHPGEPGKEFSSGRGEDQGVFCLSCHLEIGSYIKGSRLVHQPVEEGFCRKCHDVHRSDHRKLLVMNYPADYYLDFSAPKYDLCWQCHSRDLVLEPETETATAFRNGDRNLHRVHVNRSDAKGSSCKACHGVHAAHSEHLMEHRNRRHEGRWLLPISFTALPTGGNCVSGCHKPKDYDRENAISYK